MDVLSAGCDLVLHCSGEMSEMEETAEGIGAVGNDTNLRLARGEAMRANPVGIDPAAALARLKEILP